MLGLVISLDFNAAMLYTKSSKRLERITSMIIKVKYINQEVSLGTQNGLNYTVYPSEAR